MTTHLPRVALVGATGAVGETFLQLLLERDIVVDELHLVASGRSAGREVVHRGRTHVVEDLATFDFGRADLAFFSAGTSVSEKWAPVAAEAGALVIDNTNAFRMDPASPLVVPQVNGHLLRQRPANGIIANPNCSTIPLARLLRPLDERYGVASVVVSTYQAASGKGLTGITELTDDTAQVLADRASEGLGECFEQGLAFNVVPRIDVLLENRFTLEERKMTREARKILDRPDLLLTATCVRVPVLNGHSEAAYVRLREAPEIADVLTLLAAQEEVRVHDLDDPRAFPTPRRTQDEADLVHVGRVRVEPDDDDPSGPRGLWLWLVADNLRIGAALNAVQIAERLSREGAW